MKKLLLFISMIWVSGLMAQNADTLAAWTFPTGIDTLDIYPDVSIPNNSGYYLSAEDTTEWPNTMLRAVASTPGETSFAGTANEWDNGAYSKLWSIKIKAPGYGNLKVSSKQFSDPANPGPKDWIIQARLSGEDWVDLETVVCGEDWITGTVTGIELPEMFNDPGSTSIYIRWLVTSNMNTAGETTGQDGISKIDDVVITGEAVSGTGDLRFDNRFRFYPNPLQTGLLHLANSNEVETINIYDIEGRLVFSKNTAGAGSIQLGNLTSGIYFVEPVNGDDQKGLRRKLVVL